MPTWIANLPTWLKEKTYVFAAGLLVLVVILALLLRISRMKLAAAKAQAWLEREISKSELRRSNRVALAKEEDASARIAIAVRHQAAIDKIDAEAKKTDAAIAGDNIEDRVNERFDL